MSAVAVRYSANAGLARTAGSRSPCIMITGLSEATGLAGDLQILRLHRHIAIERYNLLRTLYAVVAAVSILLLADASSHATHDSVVPVQRTASTV